MSVASTPGGAGQAVQAIANVTGITPVRRFWHALLLVVAANAALGALLAYSGGLDGVPRILMHSGLLLAVAGPLLWFILCMPLQRAAREARETLEKENGALHERLRAHDLNVRLTEALDMAEDENAVLRIARQALQLASDGAPAQIMLAQSPDSPMTHSHVDGNFPEDVRCYIERPQECPAVRRGMGTVFEDSMVLSACRGLRGSISSSCAAACTPITVSGTGVGMVRALGPPGDPGLYRLLQSLNTAAHHVGTRLAVIRSISASAREAATDPLTGAANRRSAELLLSELVQQSVPYVVAMLDIDHFKKINDQHGHEVGDRAIKLLVEVLRECIRRDDLLCRYGGEEFLLVMPRVDAAAAVAMLQRLRAELPRACTRAGLPVFTVSAGVAVEPAGNPTLQVRAADAALYQAKHAGRDRVLCASEEAHVEEG